MTRAEVNAAFAPLARGLLKEGKLLVRATVEGWPVEGRRLYNSPGCSGPAWSPQYQVGLGNDGVDGTSGPRDHCVRWLVKRMKEDE